MPWEETNASWKGWKDPAGCHGLRAGSPAVGAALLPAQVSRLSGARWWVASPEHLQEERLLLPLLSFQPEMGEAEPAAAEPWQESSMQSTAGIYCNPVEPVTRTDPSSPTVPLCVFPYLQRSSLLEKSEIPESISPLSSPLQAKCLCGAVGSLVQCCPLPTHAYVYMNVYVLSTLSLQVWRVSA